METHHQSNITELQIEDLRELIKALNPLRGDYTIAHNPVIPEILCNLFGYKPSYSFYYEAEKLVGFEQGVKIGDRYVSMPHFSYGGSVGNANTNYEGNYEVRSFNSIGRYVSDEKVTSFLDVSIGTEALHKSFNYNIRRQIRIATERGVEVRSGGVEMLDDFLKVYRRNMCRLGSPPQPRRFFEAMLSEWKYGEAVVFCSYYDGKVVGGAVLLSFGGVIENCWAGSLVEYNRLFVPYVQYWTMIKYAAEREYKVFSFGRSNKDGGVLAFKRHWQPVTLPLYFNYSEKPKGDLKHASGLRKLYTKLTFPALNNFFGTIITKRIY